MKLFVTLCLLTATFFLINTTTLHAQESTGSARVNYALAEPGILPDHPLYKLKVLRDKLIPFFIGNPQKKIEFYLLQADKGISATNILVKKGKIDLAKETGLKAENNYTILTYIVKSNKWDISGNEYEKLYKAAEKHQEVLRSIISSVPEKHKKIFQTILYFSEQNEREVRNSQNSLTKGY